MEGTRAELKKEEKKNVETQFVNYLQSIAEDRGAMAALRRGLGKSPGSVPAMYPYVAPWAEKENSYERFYLIASLFAAGPEHLGNGHSFGAALRLLVEPGKEIRGSGIEKRFQALLSMDRVELYQPLSRLIVMLKNKGVSLDYTVLMKDLRWWDFPSQRGDKSVQLRWAEDFWSNSKSTENQDKE